MNTTHCWTAWRSVKQITHSPIVAATCISRWGVCVFMKILLIKNMIFKATTVEHQPLQHRSDGLFPRKCEGEKITSMVSSPLDCSLKQLSKCLCLCLCLCVWHEHEHQEIIWEAADRIISISSSRLVATKTVFLKPANRANLWQSSLFWPTSKFVLYNIDG